MRCLLFLKRLLNNKKLKLEKKYPKQGIFKILLFN